MEFQGDWVRPEIEIAGKRCALSFEPGAEICGCGTGKKDGAVVFKTKQPVVVAPVHSTPHRHGVADCVAAAIVEAPKVADFNFFGAGMRKSVAG